MLPLEQTGRRNRPLLILSCSQRKTPVPTLALELYDGPAHRQVRRFLADEPITRWPTVMILSAKHGLISQYRHIAPYEQRLDAQRAGELAALSLEQLEVLLYGPFTRDRGRVRLEHFGPYAPVFVFGGGLYREVIDAWDAKGLFRGVPVTYAAGRGNGDMMHQLGQWLEQIH